MQKTLDSPKLVEGLAQGDLASRLKNPKTGKNMDTSNVGRARKRMGEEEFLVWSKERDPDSIGWRFCEKSERYFPQDAP